MKPETIKRMLDACYLAKRIRELLPPLPEGVAPAYIQYLDVIHVLEARGTRARVSDIGEELNLPRPGVTRTVKEMEQKGYLRKYASEEDGRVTYLAITEQGKALLQKYDLDYYSRLSPLLNGISQEEADGMIETIEKFYAVMKEGKVSIE